MYLLSTDRAQADSAHSEEHPVFPTQFLQQTIQIDPAENGDGGFSPPSLPQPSERTVIAAVGREKFRKGSRDSFVRRYIPDGGHLTLSTHFSRDPPCPSPSDACRTEC